MLKKLFSKKEIKLRSHPEREFDWAMSFVREALEYEKTNEDKIIILDFMLGLIREDLKTSLITSVFYNEEPVKISPFFPSTYEDESGKLNNLETDKSQKREIDLAKDCVFVVPWDKSDLRDTIKNIFQNPFEFIDSNHMANYYPYLDICHAYNGLHSITAGIGHKKGIIKADVMDITPLFNHIYTDGNCWFNQHNHNKLWELWDFRIGVIYEVAKIKYRLEKEG
ncbi:DUF6710 family protein [Desulfitobacterium hafniense]|uniref:DUF6710 family protein n=1 Tax=Desulfitobacterium hafniense TaxID=49338 RepID=UPI00037D9AC3|nr:DUF6710 family protein [Desulfitobacterium hafniense]